MSVIKIELKEQHLKLLKHLNWSLMHGFIVSTRNDKDEDDTAYAPFGGNNLYEGIDLILNGKPEGFDPFNTEDIEEYSAEQKAEWNALYAELPMALDVILYNQSFELGLYRSRFHQRDWKKITL